MAVQDKEDDDNEMNGSQSRNVEAWKAPFSSFALKWKSGGKLRENGKEQKINRYEENKGKTTGN